MIGEGNKVKSLELKHCQEKEFSSKKLTVGLMENRLSAEWYQRRLTTQEFHLYQLCQGSIMVYTKLED